MAATQSARSLEPELAALVTQIRDLIKQVEETTGKLKPAQMLWRPDPTTWSVGECISHLSVTVDRYLPMLDAAIDKARAAGRTGKGPYQYGFLSRYFVNMLEPPVSRRFKAPKPFLPPPEIDAAKVLPDFVASHEQLIRRIERASGLDLVRVKVQSPAFSLLRMNLGKGFELMCAHCRRHLWQARQVMGNPGFPK